MLSPDDHIRPRRDVYAREFDGEIVLLDLAGGTYYGLDPLGSKVWRHTTEGRSIREVALDVLQEYDVDQESVLKDLLTLANDWIEKGLVERVEP